MTRESKIEEYFGSMVKAVLQGRVAKQTDGGGIPDRIAIVPHLPMEWVELKSEGKPLQPLQEQWRDWLLARGFRWSKLDSLSEVDDWIANHRREQAVREKF